MCSLSTPKYTLSQRLVLFGDVLIYQSGEFVSGYRGFKTGLRSRDGAVVRALASHQSGPGS